MLIDDCSYYIHVSSDCNYLYCCAVCIYVSYSYYRGRLAILCTIAMRNLRNVYTFLPLYLLSGFLICTIWMSRLVIPLSSKLKFKLQSGLKPGY